MKRFDWNVGIIVGSADADEVYSAMLELSRIMEDRNLRFKINMFNRTDIKEERVQKWITNEGTENGDDKTKRD